MTGGPSIDFGFHVQFCTQFMLKSYVKVKLNFAQSTFWRYVLFHLSHTFCTTFQICEILHSMLMQMIYMYTFCCYFLNVFASSNKVNFSTLNAIVKSTNLQTALKRHSYGFHRRYFQGFLYLTSYVNVNSIDEDL